MNKNAIIGFSGIGIALLSITSQRKLGRKIAIELGSQKKIQPKDFNNPEVLKEIEDNRNAVHKKYSSQIKVAKIASLVGGGMAVYGLWNYNKAFILVPIGLGAAFLLYLRATWK